MPLEGSTRGSAPAKRRRFAAKLGFGACATVAVLFAASEVRNAFPTMNESGFARSLRQSAWTEALSGQSVAEAWPWQNLSARMSRLQSAPVHRLGLSASLRDTSTDAGSLGHANVTPIENDAAVAHAGAMARSMEGDIALGDVGSGTVGIGDSITFTASDGATCIYRVTGRPVVDPHLAPGAAEGAQGEAGLFVCSPLESLIMRATRQAQEGLPSPEPADNQRKL